MLEQPPGPATFHGKKKPSGDLRGIFSYRVMQTAQQYLIWWMLAPRLRLHHGQYAIAGRDRTAGIEKAKLLVRAGHHWVIRGDITNYYPSTNGEEVLAKLPAPRAVLRRVFSLPLGKGYYLHPLPFPYSAGPTGFTSG